MDKKEPIKISMSTFCLIVAVVIIAIMGIVMYKLNNDKVKEEAKVQNLNQQVANLQGKVTEQQRKIDSVANIVNGSTEVSNNKEVKIPQSNNNLSSEEQELISKYFQTIWVTSDGEKILVIDFGKRFCEINKNNNSKEYGTYTVKEDINPMITLNYLSGKTIELKVVQGNSTFLMSNDKKITYMGYKGYYFGANEGDEGVFNDVKNTIKKMELKEVESDIAFSNYFQGVWITSSGDEILAIDSGKRFCKINTVNNSKEYGNCNVKIIAPSDKEETTDVITLNYANGKTIELKIVQGNSTFLMSNDQKIKYMEYEGYYFGASEGDEGVFNQ